MQSYAIIFYLINSETADSVQQIKENSVEKRFESLKISSVENY